MKYSNYSFQKLIAEALETAFELHEQNNLNILSEDTSEEFAAKLSPEQKAHAGQILQILLSQKPGWDKYRWDPSGSNKLSQTQWNYIIESLLEMAIKTQDSKFAKIFSSIYAIQPTRKTDQNGNSVTDNSAAYNSILNSNSKLRDWASKNNDIILDAAENAWGRLFYTKDWFQVLNAYKNQKGSNFGAFILQRIGSWTEDLTLKNPKVATRFNSKSLDAPSHITGKSTDLDGGLEGGDPNVDGDDDEDANSSGYDTGVPDDEDNASDKGDTGFNAIPDEDKATKRQQAAKVKFLQFQKAVMNIIKAAKTLNLSQINQKALIVLQEIVQNFLNYDEIVKKHPGWFENSDVKSVESKLKSKNLIKAANTILAQYHVNYDIFSEHDWQTKYNLGPEIIDEIIKVFNETSKYSPVDKRAYAHVFKLYALEHKTPKEISKIPIPSIYNKEKKNSGNADAAKSALANLSYQVANFQALADSILREYGFPIEFSNIEWKDYWEAGKEMQRQEMAREPIAAFSKPEETADANNLYPFQNESEIKEHIDFLANNLDKIMENVFKKLSK